MFLICFCLFVIALSPFYDSIKGQLTSITPEIFALETISFYILCIPAYFLLEVASVIFGIALCGMVIHELGLRDSLWNSLAFIVRNTDTFLFTIILSTVLSVVSLSVNYIIGHVAPLIASQINMDSTVFKTLAQNIFYIPYSLIYLPFFTSLITLAYLELVKQPMVWISKLEGIKP
jgi:hypothetical protein